MLGFIKKKKLFSVSNRTADGSYQWAGGTIESLAGQFIFFHSTIFNKTLAVCAHIDYQPLPSLCKHTREKAVKTFFFFI